MIIKKQCSISLIIYRFEYLWLNTILIAGFRIIDSTYQQLNFHELKGKTFIRYVNDLIYYFLLCLPLLFFLFQQLVYHRMGNTGLHN